MFSKVQYILMIKSISKLGKITFLSGKRYLLKTETKQGQQQSLFFIGKLWKHFVQIRNMTWMH